MPAHLKDDQTGQGLVEYTLCIVLVTLFFWVAIKNTAIGDELRGAWSKITACASTPMDCSSSS